MSGPIKNDEIASLLCSKPILGDVLGYFDTRDMFYIWEKINEENVENMGFWKYISDNKMNKLIYRTLKNEGKDPGSPLYGKTISSQFLNEIVLLFKILCMIIFENQEDSSRLAFNDGWLNLKTMELAPIDKTRLVTWHLPFPLTEIMSLADLPSSQAIPTWLNYLNTTLVKEDTTEPDEELIELIHEMFGFFLLDELKEAKAFFLVGTGENGKSVMLSVIRAIVGDEFCSSMNLQTLTMDKFALADLVSKRVNICSEEESKYIHSSKFKELVLGDGIVDAEKKYGSHFSYKPRLKFIFSTNEMPTFESANHGLRRRLMIIPFHRKFDVSDPVRDNNLTQKLIAELPGIIAWAIVGARKLIKKNYLFSMPTVCADMLGELDEDSSSAIEFFRRNYELSEDENQFVNNDVVYNEYVFSLRETKRHPKKRNIFFRDLCHNIPKFKKSSRSKNDGKIRGYLLCPLGAMAEKYQIQRIAEGFRTDDLAL